MFNNYDKKMLRIYYNKIKENFRITKWNIWQKLNRKFLITYPLIEDCARCRDCGRNVHDFHVPDDLWIRVWGDEGGILCYDCFCNRVDEMNINWRTDFTNCWKEIS
jgi:hypothetical protein